MSLIYAEPKIYDLGDSAMTIEFGEGIDIELNQIAVAFAEDLRKRPFPGLIETLPAYASATVFYDPIAVHSAAGGRSSTKDIVRHVLYSRSAESRSEQLKCEKLIEVPAHFGGDAGPDLQPLCGQIGISESNFVDIFTSNEYRVFMLGFLPGFAYMGKVDARIAARRHSKPRRSVMAGSIGIADDQTGIYPFDSPGGWQIIGRTDLRLFDPGNDEPFLFSPGDNVRFLAV